MPATAHPRRFEDLSGSRVTSDKPIAVYGGHVCTTAYQAACDHVVEQMPALKDWGQRFLTVPLYNVKSLMRVVASADGTDVRLDGRLVKTLARGEVYHFDVGAYQYHEITTSHPALVAIFAISLDESSPKDFGFSIGLNGDPFMMIVPPEGQYLTDYLVSTPPSEPETGDPDLPKFQYENVLSLIAKSTDIGGVRVDGHPLTQTWHQIGNSEYAGTQVLITVGSHSVRHVNPTIKLGAMVYGLAGYDSYGYPAGMSFGAPTCTPSQTIPGDGIDNDCDGVRDEEILDGLDNDGDGVPDEDLAKVVDPNAPNHAPVVRDATYTLWPNGPFNFPLNGEDSDGDAITYQITGAAKRR